MSNKIYESKVAEDAAKRFRMLCEYTFNITEDDGEEEPEMPDNNQSGNDGNGDMGGNIGTDINGGMGDGQNNMPSPDGNMPAPDGNMPTPDGNMSDMNGDNPEEGMGGENGGAPGFNPIEGDGNSDEIGELGDMGEVGQDDEVIDVDDLTQSQEETEEKVDDIHVTMEKGFDKLLNVIKKLDKMIDSSTNNMNQLKQEIEKRNPTPIEKLNMRAANDSYPFNVAPSDYWRNKEATSNYRIGGENEEDAKQYTITQGDIDKITDFRQICKDLDDSSNNQNLMNIFGF